MLAHVALLTAALAAVVVGCCYSAVYCECTLAQDPEKFSPGAFYPAYMAGTTEQT